MKLFRYAIPGLLFCISACSQYGRQEQAEVPWLAQLDQTEQVWERGEAERSASMLQALPAEGLQHPRVSGARNSQ